ncbi:MAG: hypothetical protein KDC12_07985 [Flavobacteriales bacterium]|nr:hypothetical protein [Flavobacteriales bacterium]
MRIVYVILTLLCVSGCLGDSNKEDAPNVDMRKQKAELILELYNDQQFDSCISVATDYVRVYEDDFFGWQMLGTIYIALGEDSMALIVTEKGISVDSSKPGVLMNMGMLLDKKGRLSEGEEYYIRALKLDSTIAQVYSNYAVNRLMSREYESAIALGKRAIQLNDNIGDKGLLCVAYHKAGKLDQRDSLISVLEHLGYVDLEKLREAIGQ